MLVSIVADNGSVEPLTTQDTLGAIPCAIAGCAR